jgi:hypothetical protein
MTGKEVMHVRVTNHYWLRPVAHCKEGCGRRSWA